MYWLLDHALYIYILLGLIALTLLYLAWINRKRASLIAGGVIIGFLLLLWILNFFIVTDQQQISSALYDMSSAVGEQRYEDIVNHLASDFNYKASNRTLNRKDVRNGLIHVIKSYGVEHVRVSQIGIERLSRAEKSADVQFRVGVSLSNGNVIPILCRSKFVIEDGQWRMQKIEFYPAFSNSDQLIQFPIP